MLQFTDGQATEVMRQPARLGARVGERAKQPAMRAGEREPAVTVAFATDDDRADPARGKADDHVGGREFAARCRELFWVRDFLHVADLEPVTLRGEL
jgi:hypothetical protein